MKPTWGEIAIVVIFALFTLSAAKYWRDRVNDCDEVRGFLVRTATGFECLKAERAR